MLDECGSGSTPFYRKAVTGMLRAGILIGRSYERNQELLDSSQKLSKLVVRSISK